MKLSLTTRRRPGQTWGTFGYVGRMAAFWLLISIIFLPVAQVFAAEDATSSDPQSIDTQGTESEPQAQQDESPPSETVTTQVQPDTASLPNEAANDDVTDNVATTIGNGSQSESDVSSGISTSTQEAVTADPSVEQSPSGTTATSSDAASSKESPSETTTATGTRPNDKEASTTPQGSVLGEATSTVVTNATTSPVLGPDVTATDTITSSNGTEDNGSAPGDGGQNSTTTTVVQPPPPQEDLPQASTSVASSTETVMQATTTLEQDYVVETPQEAATTTSTTTQQASSTLQEPLNIAYNDNDRYHFSKSECMSVGDGAYYCSEPVSSSTVYGTNRVYSAMDNEGDREIYIENGGKVTQITHNHTDDDAPYYDEVSNTIVWHRLIDGRYQIMEYDPADGTEHQLTNERYNNMQPTREGDITLWQGWVGSDWEIMMDDGGNFKMLTDNNYHDIAPHISGKYITWQSFENNVWKVKVYDLDTGETQTIGDSNGGSAENPRFVLVYDTKLGNGDVETKGYDLANKKIVPLSSTPAPAPASIPEPDQTGEKRALVQSVVQIKPKSDTGDPEDDSPSNGSDVTGSSTATSSTATTTPEEGDVVVAPFSDATSTQSVATSSPNINQIEDLTVTPTEVIEDDASTTTIDDVVVPAFVDTATSSLESQDTVATST